jgi:protein SCO1/2
MRRRGRSFGNAHARRSGTAVLVVLGAFIAFCPRASAHEAAPDAPIGFDEKLGKYVPLDASFTDEEGTRVALAELVKKRPTILALGYYRCENECGALYTGLSRALRGVGEGAGRDFEALSVSINDEESPADARREKAIALAAIEGPFPASAWRFLVGDEASIDRLCDAVGFSYRKKGEDFDHPLGLVVLAPDGKIVRYIYGVEFLPVDISMSVLEASSGIVRPTVAKLLRLCFSYDPVRKRIGFDLLRVSGIAVSALVFAFVLYLVLSGRRKTGKGGLR